MRIFYHSYHLLLITNCKWHNSPLIGTQAFHNLQAYHCNRGNRDQATILQILLLSHTRLIALMLHQFYELFYFICPLSAFILKPRLLIPFQEIFFAPATICHSLILSILNRTVPALLFWTIYIILCSADSFFLCIQLSSHWIWVDKTFPLLIQTTICSLSLIRL